MINKILLILLISLINYCNNISLCALVFIFIAMSFNNLLNDTNKYKTILYLLFAIGFGYISSINSILNINQLLISFSSLLISLLISLFIFESNIKSSFISFLITASIIDSLIMNLLYSLNDYSYLKILNIFIKDISYKLFYIFLITFKTNLFNKILKKVNING